MLCPTILNLYSTHRLTDCHGDWMPASSAAVSASLAHAGISTASLIDVMAVDRVLITPRVQTAPYKKQCHILSAAFQKHMSLPVSLYGKRKKPSSLTASACPPHIHNSTVFTLSLTSCPFLSFFLPLYFPSDPPASIGDLLLSNFISGDVS